MRWLLCALGMVVPWAAGFGFAGAPSPPEAKPSPLSAEEQRKTFSLPPGFSIELVAADPDVAKVVTVAFDDAGRMWAVTAVEYPVDENENPERAKALFAGQGRDRVLVFDTPAADGRQKPRVFAEGLAIPLGVLPYRDGAFVGHGDKVLFLRDTDGDGKADERKTVLSGFGIQDSHLFPHQFTRGPGDWFYLAQGAFNYSKVKDEEGNVVAFDQTKMARFRADGSDFETVCWGPNNIWGFVILRHGEMFVQEANDLGYPVMPFFIGAAYPGIGMHKPRPYAPFQPPLADFAMGGTGLSGLALAEDRDGFPPPYKDVMYVANPITRKIQAIRIRHDGADYELEKLPDFILCSDEWFRPVAIHFGPDSCLYIVDWYNKVISHNEVARDHPDRDKTRGRIWRVRHETMPKRKVPDMTRAKEKALVQHLSADNSWEVRAARQQIIDRKAASLAPELRRKLENDPEVTVNALWALEGLGEIGSKDLQPLAAHSHYAVRREAARLATGTGQLDLLARLSEDSHPQVRAEVVRSLDTIASRGAPLPRLVELLVRMALPSLDGPMVKTQQGGEIVKTGKAGHRDFERYLVRAALEKHPEEVRTFLASDAAEALPLENRLYASLALRPSEAARQIAKLWPKTGRILQEEELAVLANGAAQAEIGAVFEQALSDDKSRKQYLTTLLKVRDRLDANALRNTLTKATLAIIAREPRDDFWLRVATLFRLRSLEPQILAYVARTNLTADQKVSAIRGLREIEASHPHLYQQWVLAAKPGDTVQREAVLALAACPPADAVPRLLEVWPILPPAIRKVASDKVLTSKAGGEAWLNAIERGDLAHEGVDGALFEKLKALVGAHPVLTSLQTKNTAGEKVLRLTGKNADFVDQKIDLEGAFTVETWIKLDAGINNRDGILGCAGEADFNFHDARLRVWDAKHHDVIIARKPTPAEVWTHVAVTRDAIGNFQIFIDGELDNDKGTSTARPYTGLYVARTTNPGAEGPGFMLAEYRIWNVARTLVEIRANYKTTFAGGAYPEGLIHRFGGENWPRLHGDARLVPASDAPTLVDQLTARQQQEKFETFERLASSAGNLEQGKILFKNICASCHNIGGEGGQIGPSLNGAGALGLEPLLRSLLHPDEAVESGYYTFRVETKDDDLLDGFLVKQDEQAIVLRQPNSEDKRIPRGQIKRAAFSRRSMMPEGLLEGLKADEVKDLFAYLKTLK